MLIKCLTNIVIEMTKEYKGEGRGVPPLYCFVEIYFLANNSTLGLAKEFFRFYSERQWLNPNGELIKNWKVLAWQWIFYGTPNDLR